jgi:hypothetical protein
MKRLSFPCIVTCVIVSVAAPAFAQRPRATTTVRTRTRVASVPDAGMIAIGASISPTTETNSQFLGNGLEIAGNVEGYVTPRFSVRGQVGTAFWDIVGLSYPGTLQPIFFLGNAVYNWEAGDLHPYVTAGGGMYHYAFDEAGVTGSTTKPGLDLGGGVEYFFLPDTTLTGELLMHRVGNVPTNRATLGFKGSFWSFTVGAKHYF